MARGCGPLRQERSRTCGEHAATVSVLASYGSCTGACILCCTAQAATWLRERKPSLLKILITCRSAVAAEMTSSSAIWRLVNPRATSVATARSRAVRLPVLLGSVDVGGLAADG